MRSRRRHWVLTLAILLSGAACTDNAVTSRGTEGIDFPRAVQTGAELAPGALEDLKGPEGLLEPEIDLTGVIALLNDQVDLAVADTRYRADVRNVSGINVVATGGGPPSPSAWFQPAILVGAPGQTLTVALSNPDRFLHTFSVPDLRIDVSLLTTRDYGQVGALVASA